MQCSGGISQNHEIRNPLQKNYSFVFNIYKNVKPKINCKKNKNKKNRKEIEKKKIEKIEKKQKKRRNRKAKKIREIALKGQEELKTEVINKIEK